MKAVRISRLVVPLFFGLLLIVMAALGWATWAQDRDPDGASEAINAVVEREREAARAGDLEGFLAQQDPTVGGWREYQREVFERDRRLNERLAEVRDLRVEGDLAYVTLGLTGAGQPWVTGALYRKVGDRWYHSAPKPTELGQTHKEVIDGFDVEYTGWDAARMEDLEPQLREARGRVEALLGPVEERAAVRIRPSPQEMPDISFNTAAAYDARGDTIHVLSPYYWPRPENGGYEATTLAHEYAHFVVDRLARDRAPVWLNEGVAMLASGEWEHVRPALESYVEEGEVVPLLELESAFRSADPTRAYVTSAGLVNHLVEQEGADGLRRLLGLLGEGRDIDAALTEVAGADVAMFYEEWLIGARNGAMIPFTYAGLEVGAADILICPGRQECLSHRSDLPVAGKGMTAGDEA